MYDDDDDEDDEDWTYEYEDEEEEPGPDIEPDTNFTVEPGTSHKESEPEKGEVKEKKAATPPDQLHYGDDEYGSDDGSYSYVTESYSSSSFEEVDGDVRADVVLDIGKEKKKQESALEPPKKEVATTEKNKTPPSGEKDGPKEKNKPPTEPEPSKEDAKKKGSAGGVRKVKEDEKKEGEEIEKGTKAPPVPPPKPTLKHEERSEGNVTKKSAEEKTSATAKAPPAVPPKVETKGDKTSSQPQKKAAPATLPKPLSSGTKASAATGEKKAEKTVPVSISKKAEIGKAPTTKPSKVEAKGGEAAKVASVPPKAPTPLPPRSQPAKSQPPMDIKGSQPFSLPSYQPPPPPRLSRPPMRTRDQPLAKGLWEERTKSIPPPVVSNRQFQMARTQSASPTKQMFQSGIGAGGGGPGMSTLPTKAIFADRLKAFVQAERAAGITYPTLAISAIKPKPKPPPPAPPSQANLKPVSKKGVPVEEEEKKPVVDTSKSDALARAFLARAKKLAAEMEGRESSPPPPRPLSAPSSSFRRVQQPPKAEPKPDVYKEVAPRVEKPLAKPPQSEEPTQQKAKSTSPEKKATAAKVPGKAAPAKQEAKKGEVPKRAEKKATVAKVADKKVPAKKGEVEKAKPGEKKKPEKKKKEEGAKPTADKEEKKDESKPEEEQVEESPKEAKSEKEEEKVAADDEEMTEVTVGEEEGLDEEYTEVDEEEEYTEVDEEVDEEDEFTEIDEEVDEEEELADVKEGEEELGEEKEGEEEVEVEETEEGLDDEEEEEKKEEPKKRSKRKRGKKGRKGKKRKKQKSEADEGEGKAEPPEPPPKRRWIPPPRTPPEPVPMPPVEKSLCEILKEELRDGITPVKRYAKKAHNEIYLPMVIPWENEAAMQTQAGMGAFGQFRDPRIKIEDGKFGQLVEGSLKSETVLPLFEHNSKNFASQKDQYITSFGAHRRNVENIVDHHEYESEPKVKLSECVIPRVFLPADATQSDMTAFGTNRSQTTKVKYLEGMKAGCDVDSHTFISRQFKANSNENAGSHVMDRRRQVIQLVEGVGEMKHHPITECIVPRFFCNDEVYKRTGSDFGAFRPLVSEVIGGYRMDYDDERLCKLIIPYQTAPSLTS